jgi:hypothetical protein
MKVRTALQKADAAVPAEDGVIVAGGMVLLRLGKAMHGAFEERE